MRRKQSTLLSFVLILTMILLIPVEANASLSSSNINTFKSTLSFLHEHTYNNSDRGIEESSSFFAMIDIDGDSTQELLVRTSQGVMASQYTTVVYFTDKKNNRTSTVSTGYYIDSIYKGGYIKVNVSHNQSPSLSLWPYTLYRYKNGRTEQVFSARTVDQKGDYNGYFYNPSEDKDHDGVIWYINDTPMTKSEYAAYVNRYMPVENKLNLTWFKFTRANINKLNAKMISTTLALPKVKKLSNTASGVKLTWGKVNGAVRYRVFVKSGSTWKKLGDTTATSFTHKGAKSGKQYTYTVRCVSADGKVFRSSYNSKGWTTKFVATPAPPALKNTKSGVQVSWKKIAGAAKYRVFRKVGSNSWVKLTDTAKLSFLDKTARKGVTYTYTIRCVTSNGKSFTSAYNTKGRSIRCSR